MAEKRKFYRLGGKASAFFDPHQSKEENKFLNANECKELDATAAVHAAKKGEGLVELSEDEAQEFLSDTKKKELAANTEADKKLDKAAKLNEESKILKQETKNAKKALEDLQEDHEDLKEEHEELKLSLSDPEKNEHLKKAHDRIAELETALSEKNAASKDADASKGKGGK